MRFGDMRNQRQSESGARNGAVGRRRNTVKLFKNAFLFLGRDANTAVGNLDTGASIVPPQAELDVAVLAGVFHRVA